MWAFKFWSDLKQKGFCLIKRGHYKYMLAFVSEEIGRKRTKWLPRDLNRKGNFLLDSKIISNSIWSQGFT